MLMLFQAVHCSTLRQNSTSRSDQTFHLKLSIKCLLFISPLTDVLVDFFVESVLKYNMNIYNYSNNDMDDIKP